MGAWRVLLAGANRQLPSLKADEPPPLCSGSRPPEALLVRRRPPLGARGAPDKGKARGDRPVRPGPVVGGRSRLPPKPIALGGRPSPFQRLPLAPLDLERRGQAEEIPPALRPGLGSDRERVGVRGGFPEARRPDRLATSAHLTWGSFNGMIAFFQRPLPTSSGMCGPTSATVFS